MFQFSHSTHAQTYPIQANLSATLVQKMYLGGLAEAGQVFLTLTQLDFAAPDLDVRLQWSLEVGSFHFESNPNNLNSLTLSPGIPQTITGTDLESYFIAHPFSNGTVADPLPQGLATLCVKVFQSGINGAQLSATQCALFEIKKIQAPIITSFQCDKVYPYDNLTPLNFSYFQPLTALVPFGSMAYSLSVYTYPSDGSPVLTNPANTQAIYTQELDGQGFATLNPIFDATFLQSCAPGSRYLVYIHATLNNHDYYLENYGWSAPCSFTYGESVNLTTSVLNGLTLVADTAFAVSHKRGVVRYHIEKDASNPFTYDYYKVKYRQKPTGNEGYEFYWFTDSTTQLERYVSQLDTLTSYQIKVIGVYNRIDGDSTEILEFTTLAAPSYACGEAQSMNNSTVTTPLLVAEPFQKVQIGEFELTFVSVEKISDGHFRGEGRIAVPFLLGASVNVEFSDLTIMSDFVVTEGFANVKTDGLENWLAWQNQQFVDASYISGILSGGSFDSADSVFHLTINGVDSLIAYAPPFPQIFRDSTGNEVTFYANGTVTFGSYLNLSNDHLSVSAGKNITFSAASDELFGTDVKTYQAFHKNYEVIAGTGNYKYYVTNKSVSDEVNDKAMRSGTSGFETNLTWRTPSD